jgi:hypothetical protein
MPKLKPLPLKLAHEELYESLMDWLRAKSSFWDEKPWPGGGLAPPEIVRRIGDAADSLNRTVRIFSSKPDINFWIGIPETIWNSSAKMSEAVEDGTYETLDRDKDPTILVSWQNVCWAVEAFARSAAKELTDLFSKHRVSDRAILSAVQNLNVTTNVAIRCRKETINHRYMED